MKRHLLLATLLLAPLPAAAQTASTITAATITPDGALQIPAQTLPLSDFMSPELKQAYIRHIADLKTWPSQPAYDAPMSAWQAWWKGFDDKIVAPPLKRWEQLYPANFEARTIAGVKTEIITPKAGIAAKNKDRVLINLHGGGFAAGAGAEGRWESVPVAGMLGIKIVSVDYRMAPQHKFPAASEDVAAVYRELLKEYKAENIGLYGCSAGGALTAQALAWFTTHDLPQPGVAGIFCAGAARGRGDAAPWGPTGLYTVLPVSTGAGLPSSAAAGGYMGSTSPSDPMANPAASPAVLAKFPPTLFVTGTRASDLASAAYSHAQLLKAGVDSQLYVMEGGWHGAFNAEPDTPEARDTFAYIVKWFDQHLGRKKGS